MTSCIYAETVAYFSGICYTGCAKRRRSILVRSAVSEGGPKKPLKGTPVKLLVSAWDAQSWVDAGRKRICACGLRAISNGMDTPTLFPWRPALVCGRTPLVVIGSVYEADLNLQCGASRLRARNAVCSCSLPCVGRVDTGSTRRSSWPG